MPIMLATFLEIVDMRGPITPVRLGLVALLVFSYVRSAQAGFDWGSGCEGGSGKFSLALDTAGTIASVGSIPAGKWNVKVRLTAVKASVGMKHDSTSVHRDRDRIAHERKNKRLF